MAGNKICTALYDVWRWKRKSISPDVCIINHSHLEIIRSPSHSPKPRLWNPLNSHLATHLVMMFIVLWYIQNKPEFCIFQSNFKDCSGQEKTQVQLPRVSKFCSWARENRSSVAQWAQEISLISLASLNKNVSLINDYFWSEAVSKLKTARLVNH